jgi:hypothetical protein
MDRLVVCGAQGGALLAGKSGGDFNPVDTVVVGRRRVDYAMNLQFGRDAGQGPDPLSKICDNGLEG